MKNNNITIYSSNDKNSRQMKKVNHLLFMKLKTILITIFLLLFSINIAVSQSFDIKPIKNQTVTYPHELLLAFEIEGDAPLSKIDFSYQSNIEGAIIRGQSIYWKPDMSEAGRHKIKITATAPGGNTDTESFVVEVRSFNAPPRFIPIRKITIPVGAPYNLPITAIDPDGMNRNLVRYLGVNLPKGATVNGQTGKFTWTPTAKQVGKNRFRVIATDQFGAASSVDVTIRVIQISREGE